MRLLFPLGWSTIFYRASNWTEGLAVTYTVKLPSGVTSSPITMKDAGDGVYTAERDFTFEGEFLFIFRENGTKKKMASVDTRRRTGIHYLHKPSIGE